MRQHYPAWLFLLILLALACAAMLPQSLIDSIAKMQTMKVIEYESGYYSTIIRDMNEAHDRRTWEKQFGRGVGNV